jgi:hypothetical protein
MPSMPDARTRPLPGWLITMFHLAFMLFVVSLVFWPSVTLPYVLWLPFLLSVVWLVFNGCPLTHIHADLDDQLFMQPLLRPLFGKVSRERTSSLAVCVLLLVTAVIGIRMHFLRRA